jgi:hypothetical protein
MLKEVVGRDGITYNKEVIQARLEQSAKFVCRALILMYQRQCPDEQNLQTTTHCNHVGFNAADARLLTDLAQTLISRGGLTAKQIALAAKKLRKYHNQILQIILEHKNQ